MNALKSVLCAGVVGAGVLVGAPQQADAGGGFSISIGNGGYGYPGYGYGNYGYGGYGGYGGGFVGRSYGYNAYQPRFYGGPVWHDTSHYDYHQGYVVPHGNHLDYIPGHYHFHQDGHWDNVGGYGYYGY